MTREVLETDESGNATVIVYKRTPEERAALRGSRDEEREEVRAIVESLGTRRGTASATGR